MKATIILQVLIAFGAGLSALFLLYRVLDRMMKRNFEVTEPNHAYAIFQAGILLSGSLILSSVMNAAMNAIRFLNQGDATMTGFMVSLGYLVLFIAIGLGFTLLSIGAGVFAFFQLTRIDEWQQIKANNIPTALISAAFILGLSLILDDYVGQLCEALVPYPKVLQIR
jgi:uncharacterized membrane protein YjfL (UPF0719 family)